MSITYSTTAIDDRLLGVVTAIDSGGAPGRLELLAAGTVISTISLAYGPCGTVSNTILTFSGTLLDPAAANTGFVNSGRIKNSNGDIQISGLTAGIPLSGADIIISNTLNTTLISAGQVVSLLSAQIQGS